MLKAVYLTANQAWAVIFPNCSICGIGSHNKTLFVSRRELLDTLKGLRLTLNGNKVVSAGEAA